MSSNRDSGLRITPVAVAAGVGVTRELDISGVGSIIVAEMIRHGTAIGDVSLALGDQGDFFDPSPGDSFHGFNPVRRLVLRNNTGVEKRLVLFLHHSPDFRFYNTPRGV